MRDFFRKSIFLLLLPALMMVGCNRDCFRAGVKGQGQIRIAPRISHGTLENGVNYFYVQNETPKDRCFLRFVVNVGSANEKDNELGMAHTLEHLAFTDRAVSKDESLPEWFQRHGLSFGPDANAYTSNDLTVYKIDLPSCEEKSLTDALAIFRSFADGLQFRDDALAKEMNIIDAEEREYNNALDKLSEKIMENLFSGTFYLSRPVIGKKEVRSKFTTDLLTSFYKNWYHPKLMSVILVGDYGDQKPAILIENAFGSLVAQQNAPKPPVFPDPDYKHPVFILHEPEISYVETVFTVQAKKIQKSRFSEALIKDRIALELGIKMVQFTFNQMAKEKADTIRQALLQGSLIDHNVYELALSVAATPERQKESFNEAFLTLRRAAELGFTEEEFIAAKGVFSDSLEQWVVEEMTWDSDLWVNRILAHINQTQYANDAIDYQGWAKPILASLTAKDCQQALKKALSSGNHYIFAVGALSATEENVSGLAALLKNAKTTPISTKIALAPMPFQYDMPTCKDMAPVELQRLENVQAFKMTLSNGFSVVLKPTKVKQDEILIRILSDEGVNSMGEKDVNVGRLAMAALPEGGLGKHPPEQIPAVIRDKQFLAHVSLYSDRVQGSANTRNKDFQFALSYLRAFVMDPLYADVAIANLKERIKLEYAQRPHSIWAPIQHDFIKALTNNDYRVGRAREEDMLAIKREDLLAWHQKYIATKRLGMVVVGDFEPNEAANKIACTFGDLPAQKPIVQKMSPKLGFKTGINKVYEVKTKDDTSKVIVRYPLNFPGKIFPDHKLWVMQELLKEILRQKLREKKQMTYWPSVTVSDNRDANAQNWLDVVVSVPKPEAEAVRQKIRSILSKLASRGITQDQLVKAKEPYLATMNRLVTENSYWADVLAENFSQVGTITWIHKLNADIKAISLKDLNGIMKRYLGTKNSSSAIVHAI